MALHIVDRDADAAARKLAAMRKLSISDAVKMACLEAIAADMHKQPLAERLAGIHKLVCADCFGIKHVDCTHQRRLSILPIK